MPRFIDISGDTPIAAAADARAAIGVDAPIRGPGVAPNTGGDVTATIKASYTAAAGTPLHITDPGVYLVDTLELDIPGELYIGPGVTLRVKEAAVGVDGVCAAVLVTSSDVTVRVDGVIDGNRSAQDISAYNAAGGSATLEMSGVSVLGEVGSSLSNVTVIAKEITNTVDRGLRVRYVDDSYFQVMNLHDCGSGAYFRNVENITVPSIQMTRLDSDGAAIYPQSFNLLQGTHCRFGIISSTEHFSDGANSLSAWVSGATIVNAYDCSFDQVIMSTSDDPTQIKGVGISLLDCQRLSMGLRKISGYTDNMVEEGGVTDSWFGMTDLDGRYQVSSSGDAGGNGWTIGNNGLYDGSLSRSQRFTEGNTYSSFRVRRCPTYGISLKGGRNNEFTNGRVWGCRTGLIARFSATGDQDNFDPQIVRDIDANRFTSCDFSYNENRGFDLREGANTVLTSCSANNNGQARYHPDGTTRDGGSLIDQTGFYFGIVLNAELSKDGLQVITPTASDTQDFTDAASGVAGKWLSVQDPEKYVAGQTIKLIGAGVAGADLITRIDDVTQDEILVEETITTRPTVAGTGTISTSGRTVTGSGTSFTTELNARYWITAAGESRQIITMQSDTAATISSAFSSDLSGESFVIVKIEVEGIPCQKYGIYYSADTESPLQVGGVGTGNSDAFISDLTVIPTKLVQTVTSTEQQANELADGVSTLPRRDVTTSVTIGDGSLRLTYFTALESFTATQVTTFSGSTAASGATLCRVGLYTVASNGDLTLVASTANDTAMWGSTSTQYTKSLSASYKIVRGVRYAAGVLFTGTTTPTLAGMAGFNATAFTEQPRLSGHVSGQSDLPATVASGSLGGTTVQHYVAFI